MKKKLGKLPIENRLLMLKNELGTHWIEIRKLEGKINYLEERISGLTNLAHKHRSYNLLGLPLRLIQVIYVSIVFTITNLLNIFKGD